MKRTDRKRRRNDGNGRHTVSGCRERNPWSFYKLMLHPTIQSHKLRIPEMFAGTYSEELFTSAVLTVPTQESWKVVLLREDNKLWFRDGWQEFVDYFSIGFAFFLQFTYQGNSKFDVRIFDTTACEISYPFNAPNSRPYNRKPYNDHRSSVRNPPKAVKSEYDDDEQMHDDDHDDYDDGLNGGFLLASDDEELDQCEGNEYEDHVWWKYEEALALAGFSKPENPFFTTVIKKRHLLGTRTVYVPAHFARENLRCNTVKCEAYDGRKWKVKCVKGHRRCHLGSGWIFFARANKLKMGDVCVFELIDAKNYVLKVHVVKKSQIQSVMLD